MGMIFREKVAARLKSGGNSWYVVQVKHTQWI